MLISGLKVLGNFSTLITGGGQVPLRLTSLESTRQFGSLLSCLFVQAQVSTTGGRADSKTKDSRVKNKDHKYYRPSTEE